MLVAAASHHSRGSCSDQRGRGVEMLSGVVALVTTCPASSMRSALAPVVERSMPRSSVMLFGVQQLCPKLLL